MWVRHNFVSRGCASFISTHVIRNKTTMRQMTLHSPGPSSALTPTIVPIDLSESPSEGHTRVRVAACAIAYRDIIDRNGTISVNSENTFMIMK